MRVTFTPVLYYARRMYHWGTLKLSKLLCSRVTAWSLRGTPARECHTPTWDASSQVYPASQVSATPNDRTTTCQHWLLCHHVVVATPSEKIASCQHWLLQLFGSHTAQPGCDGLRRNKWNFPWIVIRYCNSVWERAAVWFTLLCDLVWLRVIRFI